MDRQRRLAVRFGLIALSLLALASLAWGSRYAIRSSSDLMLRSAESYAFVHGIDPYSIPDMTYPPSAPPILAPLVAPFDKPLLRYLWLALNLGALGWLCRELMDLSGTRWPIWLQAAVVLAIIAFKPVRLGIGMGQLHLMPTLLILLAHRLDRSGRPWLGGVLLGIALVKPTMAVPFVVWFAVRGSWKAVAGAGLIQAGAIGLTSLWLGLSPLRLISEWLMRAKSQTGAGTIDVPSLLHSFGLTGASSSALASIGVLAVGAIATYAFRNRSDLGLLALNAFIACIFVYHRGYDLVLLALVFAYLVDCAAQSPGWFRNGCAGGFACLLIVPNNPLEGSMFMPIYENVFIFLSYLYGILIVVRLGCESDGGSVPLRLAIRADERYSKAFSAEG